MLKEQPTAADDAAIDHLRDRRHNHPWWGAPGRYLHMFSFSPFAQLRSSRWNGREAEWEALAMRLQVAFWHVFEKDVTSVLVIASDAGFVAAHLAQASTMVRRGRWQVVAGVTGEDEVAEVRAAVHQLRDRRPSQSPKRYLAAVDVLDPVDLSRYADGSFGAVCAFGPFHHLRGTHRSQAIGELARVLEPGGHVLVTFRLRRGSVAQVVCDPTRWESVDDLMHLALFADPEQYGEIETPPQLADEAYTDLGEVHRLMSGAGLEEVEKIPSNGMLGWMPSAGWEKIKDLSRAAYNSLLRIDGIMNEDPWMLGMSSEIISVWRKPVSDSATVADSTP